MSQLFMERGLSIVEIAVRNSVSGYQLILGKRLDEMQLLFKQITTNAELWLTLISKGFFYQLK